MAFEGLTLIGESINDSVPSTNVLYESGDFVGISELAQFQERGGAKYIDVNVGTRSPEMMKRTVQAVLSATSVPVSIDSPDYDLAKVGLIACDPLRGKPILNSISSLRTEMFNLYSIMPFRPILLLTEYVDRNGENGPSRTVDNLYSAALFLFEKAKQIGIENDDIIFDPGVSPIGSDSEGALGRLIGVLEKIHSNPDMKGVHASVGLSNFTVMLPSKRKVNGDSVKSLLESALLTIAFPLGLDYVIGSVKRKYEFLPEDSEALLTIRECISLGGFSSIKRIRKFYR